MHSAFVTILNGITIPENVTSIGKYAFYECSSLTGLTIPTGVKSIGDAAFGFCRALTGITVPEGVTKIGDAAFAYCSSLASITIPESVKNIGSAAFECCDGLTDVYYGGSEGKWKYITISSYNECLTNATIHYTIEPTKLTIPSGRTLTYNGKAQTGVAAGTGYTVSNGSKTAAGTYTATVSINDKINFMWSDGTTGNKTIRWTIDQAANPLTAKGKTATVKYSAVKKKTQTVTVKKAFTVSKNQGTVTYKKSSGNKKITVSSAGTVTVKKGLKKGTYKVKVKVKAAGNANYKAATKNVTLKIKVK